MIVSVIFIGWWLGTSVMYIPKVIGVINRFIHNTHANKKLLPLKNRLRGNVEAV